MLEPTGAGCLLRALCKGSECGITLHHRAAAGFGGQACCVMTSVGGGDVEKDSCFGLQLQGCCLHLT